MSKVFVLLLAFCFFLEGLTACAGAPAAGQPSGQEQSVENTEADENTLENEDVKKLEMEINGTEVPVTWEDNESVAALMELASEEEITIQMSMYGGFEQVGPLGTDLPRDDEQTTTSAGDIVLYSGDQIVVFYGSNSWAYTRLGHIDLSVEEMSELLSHEEVTITISVEKGAADLTVSATEDTLPDLYALETYDSVPDYYLERHEDVDMYTDILADKNDKTEEEMRLCYDKAVQNRIYSQFCS